MPTAESEVASSSRARERAGLLGAPPRFLWDGIVSWPALSELRRAERAILSAIVVGAELTTSVHGLRGRGAVVGQRGGAPRPPATIAQFCNGGGRSGAADSRC